MEYKYIIDANVFITAHRQRYPFDIAPSFWEQLVDKAADKILIIEDVQNEILKGKDLLAEWYCNLAKVTRKIHLLAKTASAHLQKGDLLFEVLFSKDILLSPEKDTDVWCLFIFHTTRTVPLGSLGFPYVGCI